jgi:hypothetical protein
MPLTQLAPPYPIFTDKNGDPLDAGYLYFGTANLNPETNPIQVYYDSALTQPAAQPIRTINGYPSRNGSPALIYANAQFSVTVRDKNNALVIYSPVGYGILPGTSASSTDQMTYNEGSTGAVTRVLTSRLQDYVSVKDFGAVGDGVADDTAAIGLALDAVGASGGVLVFPPGRYLITSGINKRFADGVTVSIQGYGAVIDASSVSSLNVIQLGGQRVSSTALGANVSKNSDTFTVASASGITPGRILLISSTDLWNPSRPAYVKGELALVELIGGTTITNSNPLYDGYTAATTTVHLLDMPQVIVEGLEIECDDDNIALEIYYSRNPTVRNCKVHGSRYAGVFVGYCLGGQVDGNFIYDVWNGTVTGASYGVGVVSCQGVKVTKNEINNARHAISSGGFEPVRDLIYSNNACSNSTRENNVGCIDIHGNTELFIISDNIASSVVVSGINGCVQGNILNSAETTVGGIRISQEINSDYYDISGNVVTCAGASAAGIFLSPEFANCNIKQFVVAGNTVSTVANAFLIRPSGSSITGCSINNLFVRDNQLTNTGAFQAFLVNNNGAATYTIGRLSSSNNYYDAANHDAFTCVPANPITLTTSAGDIFRANRLNFYVAAFAGVDVTLTSPVFEANTGGAGVSRSVLYQNTGRITVANPRFGNLTFKAEINSATEYVESGWHSSTPTITNPAGARLINFYGTLGRATTYGTAVPVANAWAVGDRVINQTPVVGQPKSWVCTVAGTPGTWVSEGNL